MKSGKDLTDEEIDLYSRQIALAEIGYRGQVKLRNARICVAGVGGLGSVSAMRLAAMGVGFLRLVDRDIVSQTDLHRQVLYDRDLVGYPKVEAAAKKISRLNPDVVVDPIPAPVIEGNADDLIRGMDVVIDGLDSIKPRYVINRACHTRNIPYVFGSAIELYGNVSTIIPNKTPCLECFYVGIDNEALPRCATVGVHPSIVGVIANTQVFEAVNLVLGHPPTLTDKIFYADLKHMTFDSVVIKRRVQCPVCGTGSSEIPHTGDSLVVEEMCGREGNRLFMITPPHLSSIDLEKMRTEVASEGKELQSSSELGITFTHRPGVNISFLKSGCMVLTASPDTAKEITQKEVTDLYNGYKKRGEV
ncbi:HesA/MoeB/ThiF family protein [[Eubacterium] cellulosolvens]